MYILIMTGWNMYRMELGVWTFQNSTHISKTKSRIALMKMYHVAVVVVVFRNLT